MDMNRAFSRHPCHYHPMLWSHLSLPGTTSVMAEGWNADVGSSALAQGCMPVTAVGSYTMQRLCPFKCSSSRHAKPSFPTFITTPFPTVTPHHLMETSSPHPTPPVSAHCRSGGQPRLPRTRGRQRRGCTLSCRPTRMLGRWRCCCARWLRRCQGLPRCHRLLGPSQRSAVGRRST